MSQELNILQAIEMPVGTVFKVMFQGCDSSEKVYLDETEDKKGKAFKWCDCELEYYSSPFVTSGFVEAKFIPIQKPVSFMKAVQQAGKKRFKIVHPLYKMEQYATLKSHLGTLSGKYSSADNYSSEDIQEIMLNCKCYFEELM